MSKKVFFTILFLCFSLLSISQVNYLNETKAEKDKRMEWWRNARFGMFIHWGLYAVPAGEYKGENSYGEWIMDEAQITIPEYEKYAYQFNPVKFNADTWVKMASDAGVKYIVITTKHHDGFSLYDSQISDYDIIDRTPFKRDPLKELAEACKKYTIKLCFYHSIMDWHHPNASKEKFSLYRDNYLKTQLKELLTNYGDIGALWFDGEWIEEWTEDQGKDLYNYVRNLQPNIIINNRVGKGRSGMQGMNSYENAAGDFGTPEQEILGTSSAQDWESCMTMNDHWGYNKSDTNFKSSETLIWNLVDCAAKGGNYLLNVGPTAEGLIPDESVKRMNDIGEWMQVNSKAIYKSQSWVHYDDSENIRYTTDKQGNIFVFVKGWPGDKLYLRKVKPNKGSKIKLLGTDALLNWKTTENGIDIILSDKFRNTSELPCKHIFVFQLKGKALQVCSSPTIGNQDEQTKGYRIFDSNTTLSITSSEPNSTIYYTLDGSIPTIHSSIYTGPLKIEKSCIIKAIGYAINKANSNVITFEVRKAKYNIEILSTPSPKYIAGGSSSLVDGKQGSDTYSDGNWMGFEGVDFESIVDLNDTLLVKKIAVSFIQAHNSWIFLPLSLEVYFSDSGKNFTPAGVTFGDICKGYEPNKTSLFSVFTDQKARYIKIKAKNTGICPVWHKGSKNMAWLFVSEIYIE